MEPIKSITLTRVFSAPRQLVFDAWLDEKHLAAWWSPRGFTNPICRVEGREGGTFLIHMFHPDFGEMPVNGRYEEVTPLDRIVLTTSAFPDAEGVPQLEGHNTVEFSDAGPGQTRIVLTAALLKLGPGLEGAADGMEQGWNESLDRLGENVEDTSDREMAIDRLLDAPRDLVWKAFTEADHVAQWWGPNGFTNTIHKMDVKQGGQWQLTMHGPDGTDYANRIHYLEVIPQARLIWDHGNDQEPALFRSFVTFATEGDKTRVRMRLVFPTTEIRNETADKYGAREGQVQTFARLAAYLNKMQVGSVS